MPNDKKEMLLKEIAFWKTNKLLPAHYCDFLTTLYTGGEEEVEDVTTSPKPPLKNWGLYIGGALLAIVLVFAMFFLSAKYVAIPIVMSIVAIVIVLYFTFRHTSGQLMRAMTYAVAAMLILALSVRLTSMLAPDNTWMLYSVLIANCGFWLVSGSKMKLLYFTISGYMGLAVIVLFGFFA